MYDIKYSEKQGFANYWQLDDDIGGLYYRQETKLIRSGFEVLTKAKEETEATKAINKVSNNTFFIVD